MKQKPFKGSFTQQEPISEEAIAAAVDVLRSGRLHRYNTRPGIPSQASELETRFARYMGTRYCLACASGGYALHIALRAADLQPGESVLTNAFTLAPVPGAIVNAGGLPVFVETTADLVIDLEDLKHKLEVTGARFLLLSHMRGHMVDMDALSDMVSQHGVRLIEDCAHTMGARWNGHRSGAYGLAGCFSTQTYKHMNSGEGGLLVSDDADFMAKATLMSGSYMLYERHGAVPDVEVFRRHRLETPNFSGRMDNLRAAILLPQLDELEINIQRWNALYEAVENRLRVCRFISLPERPRAEHFVGSSLQFSILNFDPAQSAAFVDACARMGVEVKWFGRNEPIGFTSTYKHWRYVSPSNLPKTDGVLAHLFDMRLPLTFSISDCEQIGEIICSVVAGMAPSLEIDR